MTNEDSHHYWKVLLDELNTGNIQNVEQYSRFFSEDKLIKMLEIVRIFYSCGVKRNEKTVECMKKLFQLVCLQISESNSNYYQNAYLWLESNISSHDSPLSLQEIAINEIRKSLGLNLSKKLARLDEPVLPMTLQSLIKFEDIIGTERNELIDSAIQDPKADINRHHQTPNDHPIFRRHFMVCLIS